MKALIQRVTESSVAVNDTCVGKINHGLLLLLGIEKNDTTNSVDKLLKKILFYRVFSDANGKMNLNVQDVNGGILVVSQFTLAAETKKGLRPGFSSAAPPEKAKILYEDFVSKIKLQHACVATGVFSANMQVSLVNDGPVTFMLEST